MPCPLCADPRPLATPRWSRPSLYLGRRFEHRRCPGCASLVCDPMPDADVLAAMYGEDYADEEWTDAQQAYDDWVLARLAERPVGRFLDHGCGRGRLLERVRDAGWEVAGVELDAAVTAAVSARLGVTVVTPDREATLGTFDVVHLGDVLEHLTDVEAGLRAALALVAPGGALVAQGPLEGNTNLFTVGVRSVGLVKRTPTSVPPYHVLLATGRGQRALFERVGLATRSFEVEEVAWPAPLHLDPSDRKGAALWALRRASQLTTRALGGRTGNRYRYEGIPATRR